MFRISTPLAVAVALVLATFQACQTPPAHPPRMIALKTVHPPVGRCGHHPAPRAVADEPAR